VRAGTAAGWGGSGGFGKGDAWRRRRGRPGSRALIISGQGSGRGWVKAGGRLGGWREGLRTRRLAAAAGTAA